MVEPEFDGIDRQLNAAASRKFRVFGIRRCGQHAVINWLLRNCGQENHVFLNSCTMGKSAIRTCGQSEINGRQARRAHPLKKTLEPRLAQGESPFVLISYEAGYPPRQFEAGGLTNGFSNQDFESEILITRSFVNWLPSFIRLMRVMNRSAEPQGLDNSAGITFEMQRYRDHLIAAQASEHRVISFDNWFTEPEYRLSILEALGLPAIDNGLGEVQVYGGGSSFTKFALGANELDLNTRWKSMSEDPFAKQFLKLAQKDTRLMAALEQGYPEDIGLMNELLKNT